MMEEVGMVMRGLWRRRNGVMRAISIASICMNVVMLVLNKRSKMGSYWSALVQMVTSHPSLQGPLLYLLFNILLIFPLLLQSGLLKHHPHHHHHPHYNNNKSTMPIASHGNSYTRGIVATMTISTTSNHNNRASSGGGGGGGGGSRRSPLIKHATHDHDHGENHAISHNKHHPMHTTSTSRLITHKKNLHKVSPPPPPHSLHFEEHSPRPSHLSSNGSHSHPHRYQDHLHEKKQQQPLPLLHHPIMITPHLPIIGMASACATADTPSQELRGESAHGDDGDVNEEGRGGGVRREKKKKASLFTIEPWKEEEEEEAVNEKKKERMEEEEEEEEEVMSSVELKEKAERFIGEFRRKNLMMTTTSRRQDSFNRLLALLRSSTS